MQIRDLTSFSLNDFLRQDLQVIRIYTNTGANFGNQAATANLLRRLRSLGFNGTFEFIYPAAVRSKIQYLFNLPNDISDVYRANDGVVFYTLQKHIELYLNCSLPPIQLAMTGAWDDYYKAQTKLEFLTFGIVNSVPKFDLEKYAEGVGVDFNFANLMNANVFIRFSQWQTSIKHPLFADTVMHLRDRTDFIPQIGSGNQFIVAPPHHFSDGLRFLQTRSGRELLASLPALATLISAYQNESIKIMPCYGQPLLSFNSPLNLIAMVAGARYAQLRSDNVDPVIVTFLHELDDIAIQEIILTLEWARSVSVRREMLNLNLRSVLTIASLSDRNAEEKILNVKRGQILLLATGPLPQIMFNTLYAYSGPNVLLQVREGPSSFIRLLPTGRPNFRCGGMWELGFDDANDEKLKNHLINAGDVCGQKDEAWEVIDVPAVIGEYILDAQNPNSSLSLYFKNLSRKALDPNNDRILSGITRGVELLSESSWNSQFFSNAQASQPRLPHCQRATSRFDSGGIFESSHTLIIINLMSLSMLAFLFWILRKNRSEKISKHSNDRYSLFKKVALIRDAESVSETVGMEFSF
jgi:hypothetical protein